MPENNVSPLKKGKKSEAGDIPSDWRNDPFLYTEDWSTKLFIVSKEKDGLFSTSCRFNRHHMGLVSRLLASGQIPHANQSEFVRDSVAKNLLALAQNINDPDLKQQIAIAKSLMESQAEEKAIEEIDSQLTRIKNMLPHIGTGKDCERWLSRGSLLEPRMSPEQKVRWGVLVQQLQNLAMRLD